LQHTRSLSELSRASFQILLLNTVNVNLNKVHLRLALDLRKRDDFSDERVVQDKSGFFKVASGSQEAR
jgi:hypothetical protein